ncbi:putative candidate secreted effector protein [Blumeria hordei DH14]|uniref:Putative candidate secreted effector protein n=1 Tax=Blumeria graminis f. sp. hordei (strain DH14) TaxID=546991 RepID=N1J701_BLUG1|nr:putative candidate secreted effector protein [Blumeria hordei DH14]
MWINFNVTLAISWLILQVKCDDIPYSDMYLPDGTNGFVCDLEFHSIDHVREVAKKGVEAFFYRQRVVKFPTTFKDTKLFNVKSDILLSWPIMPSGLFYHKTPGKSRLIINTRGQILGIVVISFEKPSNKIIYEKCIPVRSSLEENNEEQTLLNECWGLANPTFGYNCGSKFFPKFKIDKMIGPNATKYYQQRLSGKHRLSCLRNYTGDVFTGVDLYWYPFQLGTTEKATSGPPGRYRVVYDISNSEFKGIIDVEEGNIKCGTVWDVSSISLNNIYISSSTLNLDRFRDSYWPETCFGHKLKAKTIWLYLEFALKDLMSTLNGSNPNLPIGNQKFRHYWLLRPEETNKDSSNHVFVILYNTELNTYYLYLITTRNFKLDALNPCLQFSSDVIHVLQKHIGDKHNPEESLSIDHW